jgi:hypothetical protein
MKGRQDRIEQLIQLRNQIDAELAAYGVSVIEGRGHVNLPQERHSATADPLDLEERVRKDEDFLFNIFSRFPGWRSRLEREG